MYGYFGVCHVKFSSKGIIDYDFEKFLIYFSNKGSSMDKICGDYKLIIDKLNNRNIKIGFSYLSINEVVIYAKEILDKCFLIKSNNFLQPKLKKLTLEKLFLYSNKVTIILFMECIVGKYLFYFNSKMTKFKIKTILANAIISLLENDVYSVYMDTKCLIILKEHEIIGRSLKLLKFFKNIILFKTVTS